jgi:hypothetical protein
MKEFDFSKPAMVHDRISDRTFEWKVENAVHYRQYATPQGDFISWDGLLLDGWMPIEERRPFAR